MPEEGKVELKDSKLTPDALQDAMRNDSEIAKVVQQFADKRVTEGIETFKTNKLQSLIDAAVKEHTKKSELTPEQKQLKELQEKVAMFEAKSIKETHEKTALIELQKNKLDNSLMGLVMGKDEAEISQKVKLLHDYIDGVATERVKAKLKELNRSLPDETTEPPENPYGSNPWSVEGFNVTTQAKIMKEKPKLAALLMKQAISKKE